MTQDRVTIVEPNGVERTRPIPLQGLTIGRGADNGLPLNYDLVSRHHARITIERGRYYVTDLNSANGTFLGKRRLAPNVATAWPPGQSLQIGGVVLYLEQVTQPQSAAVETGETVVGHFSDDTLMRDGKKEKKRRTMLALWVVIGLALLCVLVGLGAGGYYYFYVL